MRYILIAQDGRFGSVESVNPTDLMEVEKGDLLIARLGNDGLEFAEVTHREVDNPNNSLDETRYDQAIDGQIYEISNWKPLPPFDREKKKERRK